MPQGTVIRGVGGLYAVLSDGSVYECRARGGLKKDGNVLTVGDEVCFEPNGAITRILPRKNLLPRPAVANLDVLLIVAACSDPLPNLYTLDKLAVISSACGVEPIFVFNKTDLPDPLGIVKVYRGAGYRCFSVCAKTGEGVESLKEAIEGKICAFAGLSGVGKSSLINAICPDLLRTTGEISRKLQRGKHTTRAVELFPFGSGFLADTPGFSELDFSEISLNRDDLASYFPEFEPYRSGCRFSDCTHRKELGCRLLDAVRDGFISAVRHENYLRMYDEIGPLRPWEKTK